MEREQSLIEVKPNRLASADILKVLSIIAVVFIHGSFLIPNQDKYIGFIQSDFFPRADWSRFCVPVFVFIWAYFLEKSCIKRGNENLLPRFYKLFVPFLIWSIIYFLIIANFHKLSLSILLTTHFSGFGWSGQYYFIILFQFILLFPIIRRVSLKLQDYKLIIYIVSTLFYVLLSYTRWFDISIVEKINHRLFIYWLPYVILGIMYAHKGFSKSPLPPLIAIFSVFLSPQRITSFIPKMSVLICYRVFS